MFSKCKQKINLYFKKSNFSLVDKKKSQKVTQCPNRIKCRCQINIRYNIVQFCQNSNSKLISAFPGSLLLKLHCQFPLLFLPSHLQKRYSSSYHFDGINIQISQFYLNIFQLLQIKKNKHTNDKNYLAQIMDYEKLSEYIPKSTSSWTIDDTCRWLDFIELAQYKSIFCSRMIDGSNIKDINLYELEHGMGIISKIQQKKLLNWIEKGLTAFDSYLEGIKNVHLNNYAQKWSNNNQMNIQKSSTTSLREKQNASVSSLDFLKRGAMIVEPYEGGCNLGMHVVHNQILTIGYGKNNHIQSLEISIQDKHALIGQEEDRYFLQDLGSTNGTYTKVCGRETLQLKSIIQLGSYQFQVIYLNTRKKHIHLKLYSTIDRDDQHTIKIDLQKQKKYSFGRKKSNNFSADDKHLSGIHCWVMFLDGVFMIQDFSSTNGTWVRLSLPHEKSPEVELKNESIIKLGTTITYICRIHEEKKHDTFMEDEGDSCPGCFKATKNCLAMPCQHNVYCWQCGKNKQICFQCGNTITQNIQLYN